MEYSDYFFIFVLLAIFVTYFIILAKVSTGRCSRHEYRKKIIFSVCLNVVFPISLIIDLFTQFPFGDLSAVSRLCIYSLPVLIFLSG